MSTITGFNSQQAQVAIGRANKEVTESVANLVSGKKENANVADFSVGTVLKSRVSVLTVATLNAGQGQNLLQTARGALSTIVNILEQQTNLAAKASDDSLSDNERGFLNQEFQALSAEIDRIADSTNFNGKKLLDGSISGVAGVTSSTGLSNENYSLLNADQITTSGAISSGSLNTTHAVFGETTLNFGAVTTGATVTFSIDADGSSGTTAAQTTSYTTEDGDTAAEHAARFVAAANAETDVNFQQFTYTDNGDGSVTVKAKEAGDYVNNYYFSTNSNTGGGNGTVGIGGVAGNIDDSAEVVFTTGTNTDGANGIFKSIAANNIVDTALTGSIEFGGDASGGANSVNGTKAVHTFQVTAVGADSDVLIFSDGTNDDAVLNFATVAADADGSDGAYDIEVNASIEANAASIAAALNEIAANDASSAAARFTFTASGDTVTATQISFTDNATTVAEVNNISFTPGVGDTIDGTGNQTATAIVSSDASSLIILRDANGTAVATTDITVSANTGTSTLSAAEIAGEIATQLNASGSEIGRYFTFQDNNDGTISFTANDKDLNLNFYALEFDLDGGAGTGELASTVQFGGVGNVDITTNGTGANFNTSTAATDITLASTKSIALADLTFDERLQGALSNLTGAFNYNVDSAGNNTVQFTVDVGGATYTSQEVYLKGTTATSTSANAILAGTVLTFQSATGETDSNGAFTNNGFQLTFGSNASLADVSSAAAGQESLSTVVTALQTQLDSITINQDRSLAFDQINASSGDHRIKGAVGTILDGLRGFDSVGTNRLSYNDGDIRLVNSQYGDSGTISSIGSFTVDRLTDTITTTVGNETYVAYLNANNAPTTGGVRAFGTDFDGSDNAGAYNATQKTITLDSNDSGNSAKLEFYSTSTTDGGRLTIDLGNVASNTNQINISTDEGELALASALNAAFGVAANESLSFQVGDSVADSIGVSINSAKTTSLFVDDDGVEQSLTIATLSDAQDAGEILANARNVAISLIAEIDSTISRFDAAIQNNEASIQNADAARSVLLDTDYSEESTNFAIARVKVDAASAVLSQVNARIQNLLQLLQQ